MDTIRLDYVFDADATHAEVSFLASLFAKALLDGLVILDGYSGSGKTMTAIGAQDLLFMRLDA
jgi:hypothetical protein